MKTNSVNKYDGQFLPAHRSVAPTIELLATAVAPVILRENAS